MKKTILVVTLGIFCSSLFANNTVNEVPVEPSHWTLNISALPVSSFCKAIIQGDYDLVKKMIALGEDVNQKSLGKTPAHYAARYNKSEILELLIENGANLKKKCDKGFTVEKYAEQAQASEALEVINAAKAN